MPRLLFVTHNFPPDTTIGSKRCRRIAATMSARGWQVHVLAARDFYAEGHDPALLAGLEQVEVTRTHALNPRKWWHGLRAQPWFAARSGLGPSAAASPSQDRGNAENPGFSRASMVRAAIAQAGLAWQHLEIPDSFAGGFGPALAAAATLPRPDVVLTTVPWFSNAPVGAAVARMFKRPMVLEYRDPWTTRLDPHGPAWRQALERQLELWCLEVTRSIVTTTPGIQRQLQGISAAPVHVAYNATDPDDFIGATARRYNGPTLVYAGGLYGGRRIEPLLDAMARVGGDLRLHYMGASAGAVTAALADRGLQGRATVEGPVKHSDVIAAMLGARCNVCIVGPEHVRQVPGKLFEQIGCGRPLLLLGPPDSDAEAVIDGIDGCAFARLDDPEGIQRALRALPTSSRTVGPAPGFSVQETMDVVERALVQAM